MNGKIIVTAILAIVVGFYAAAVYWSQEPEAFAVMTVSTQEAEKLQKTAVIGVTTTATLVRTIETLLDKPGGFLSNDVMPPFVLMDNMPNWEIRCVSTNS